MKDRTVFADKVLTVFRIHELCRKFRHGMVTRVNWSLRSIYTLYILASVSSLSCVLVLYPLSQSNLFSTRLIPNNVVFFNHIGLGEPGDFQCQESFFFCLKTMSQCLVYSFLFCSYVFLIRLEMYSFNFYIQKFSGN